MNIFDSWTLENWGQMPMTEKPPMLAGIRSPEDVGPRPRGIMSTYPMALAGERLPEDVGPRPRGIMSSEPMALAGVRYPEDIGPRPRAMMSPGSATAIPLGQAPNPISSTGEVPEDQGLLGSSVPNAFSGLMNPPRDPNSIGTYGVSNTTPLETLQPTTDMDVFGSKPEGDVFKPQNPGSGRTDVSGFVNYGMTPPELPNPMKEMAGLMSMAQYQNQPKQQAQMPQGGLMAYLQQLGAF